MDRMDTLRIRELNITDAKKIYEQYMTEDFPPAELKPFVAISRMMNQGDCRVFGASLADAFVGYAVLIFHKRADGSEYCLLDYFAIVPGMRGRGIGSLFLPLLAKHLSFCEYLLIETEDPAYGSCEAEREEQEKRVSFYEKNGAYFSGIHSKLYGVEYRIMALPCENRSIESDRMKEDLLTLYHAIYPKEWFPGLADVYRNER